MPLKKTGKKVLKNMEKEYGEKKGKSVFYASINAKKKGTEDWHMMDEKDMGMMNSPLMKYGKKNK